jgi:CRISPR-associated protein Cmr6
MSGQSGEYCLSNEKAHDDNVKEWNEKIVNAKFKSGKAVQFTQQSFALSTMYPGLLMGLGNPHQSASVSKEIAEIKLGFTFDYVTGIPVIPGSTVKGVLRSAFLSGPEYIADITGLDSAKVKALEFEIFGDPHPYGRQHGFAHTEATGTDTFLDAVAVKAPVGSGRILGLENITPHDLSGLKEPNPLTLLKIIPEVTFLFRFIVLDGILTAEKKLELFKTIILDLGIGAKTNTGFGVMKTAAAEGEPKELILDLDSIPERTAAGNTPIQPLQVCNPGNNTSATVNTAAVPAGVPQDRTIKCKDCGKDFTFTARDQSFFKEKGYNDPVRCKECRDKKKNQ